VTALAENPQGCQTATVAADCRHLFEYISDDYLTLCLLTSTNRIWMTAIYRTNVVIKPCDPEGLCTFEGRECAKELISAMEGADVSAPSISYTLAANFIETNSTAVDAVDARLRASGLNREGCTEYYMDVEPVVAHQLFVSPAVDSDWSRPPGQKDESGSA